MNETKVKLSDEQMEQFARLIVNFSSDTANSILSRFDRTSRNLVRSKMADLAYAGCSSDETTLSEFADFLYFEPNQVAPKNVTPEIRKPQVDRINQANQQSRTGMASPPRMTFQDIVGFSDVSLESLLKAAPPELTIDVLMCSPESFVRRVMAKLSASEARVVQKKISQTALVDFAEMQKVHQRYCDFATYMIDNGLLTQ